MELTVLGCSGSYGAPVGGACSGYLVRAGDAVIWMDCGNGTFANLHQHVNPGDLTAVVITHAHADHCVDIYGLHVLYKYGLERSGLPVYAPEGVEHTLEGLVGEWTDTFDWKLVGDGDRDTIADVNLQVLAHRSSASHRRASTSRTTTSGSCTRPTPDRTGASMRSTAAPTWCCRRRRTSTTTSRRRSTCRRAKRARRRGPRSARRLMLTHLWPTLDPVASVEEGSEAFGHAVSLAAPHLVTHL